MFLLAWTPGLFLPIHAQTSSNSIPGTIGRTDDYRSDMALNNFVLGAMYECEENYPQALTAYENALNFDDNAVIHLAIARVARELPDEITAVHHLVHALETRPDDAALLRQLGEVYSARQQADSATYVLEQLRRIEGNGEQLLLALGGLYAQQRMFDQAAATYDTLRRVYPEKPMFSLMLAEMELNRGKWDKASDILFPLSADSAVGHEDRVRIGKLYFQRALQERIDIERALTVFNSLIRDFPADWRPLWFRGAVLFNTGSVSEAMRDFEMVMQRSPGNTEAGMILARAYLTQQRPADAIKVLQQLIDRGAAGTETWTLLSYAWSSLGKDDRAVEALEQARRSDPGNLDILATLAITYAGLLQYDSSDAAFEAVIRRYDEVRREKDERYYLLLNNYAFSLAERDMDLDRALLFSSEAVAFAPGNSAYCDTRGWIAFRMQKYDDALEWLREALRLREASDTPSASLHEHLGEVYRALDRLPEARAHWKEALRQEPDNQLLQEKLQMLGPSDE